MKSLCIKDMFLLSKIIKKLNLKDKVDESKSKEEIGKDILFYILENVDTVKDEVEEIISNVIGVEKDKVIDVPIENLIKAFKNMDGLNSFFQSVGNLTK